MIRLLVLSVVGALQMTHRSLSSIFSPSDSPISFTFTGDFRLSSPTSTTYSVTMWVKFQVQPTSPLTFCKLTSQGAVVLEMVREVNGSITAAARTRDSVVVTANNFVDGYPLTTWTLVAACACEQDLWVYVILWDVYDVFYSSASSASGFQSVDPFTAEALIGGVAAGSCMTVKTTQGQVVDARFMAWCITDWDFWNIAGDGHRSSQCSRSCDECNPEADGPGDRACLDFVQLTNYVIPVDVTNLQMSWSPDDPYLQGRNMLSTQYSYTGWYFQTNPESDNNGLFRTQNVPGDSGTPGNRLLSVILKDAVAKLAVDTATSANEESSASFLVCPMQSSYMNVWYFVGVSFGDTDTLVCIGLFGDPQLTCTSGVATDVPRAFDGTIYLGDPVYNNFVGKVMDNRYHFGSKKTEDDFNWMFQRDTATETSCFGFSSLDTCNLCGYGTYPTGAYCKRKRHSACLSGCASCVIPWKCVGCDYLYFRQPFSTFICMTRCPTGSSANSDSFSCDGEPSVVTADFVFDAIGPALQETRNRLINGDTENSPPDFEPSDALPSDQRGYYFGGAQYMQFSEDHDVWWATSGTVEVWLRPQSGSGTLYHKTNGSVEVLGLRLEAFKAQFFGGYPRVVYTHTAVLPADVWTYLVVTFELVEVDVETTVRFYIDGVLSADAFSEEFYVRDENSPTKQTVGASTSLADYFTGFLWRLKLRNYVWPDATSALVSAGCPVDLPTCLSASPFSQTADGQPCLASCTNGCVRPTDCRLCIPLCAACSRFDTCDSCVDNADLTTQCSCVTSYFPNLETNTCDPCSNLCLTCTSLQDCLQCVQSAHMSSGACICDSGFIQSGQSCVVCSGLCATCINGTNSGCTSCKANSRITGALPNRCECFDSYYLTADSTCEPCSPICLACQDSASKCISCKPRANLYYLSCVCDSSAYPATDASNCQACHATCSRCSGPGASDCLACLAEASLVAAAPSACKCNNPAVADPTNCVDCFRTCATCAVPNTIDKCSTCKANSHLSGPSPAACTCDSGFYRSGLDCLACSVQCLECTNGSDTGCTTCGTNAALAGTPPSTCKCLSGFRRETGPCVKCVNYFPVSSVSALIDSSFMKLVVTFPGAVEVSGLQSCEYVFSLESLLLLGESPQCTWSPDATVFTVLLGRNYSLRNSQIVLKTENIGAAVGNCTAAKEPLALSVFYQSPRVPPSAVITAPTLYSPVCGTGLRVTAAGTMGLSGQLGLYKWALALVPGQRFLALFDSYLESNYAITIPNSELSGERLEATLYVKDAFGGEGTATASVVLDSGNRLQVTLDSPPVVLVSTTVTVAVSAQAKFTCGSNAPGNLVYSWSLISGPLGSSPVFESSSYQLNISPGQLLPKATYAFMLSVSSDASVGTVNLLVKTQAIPLVIVFDRSDGDHQAGSDLVISAAASKDPDDSSAVLKYRWMCNEGTSPCLDTNGNLLLLPSEAVLKVDKAKLRMAAKYSFALVLSTVEKRETAVVTITIVQPSDLGISIATESIRLPTDRPKVVYPKIVGPADASFLWVQVGGKPLIFSTPLTVPWLGVASNQIKSGQTYTMALTMTSAGSKLTQYLTIIANVSPAFGSFTATPTSGVAIVDDFLLQAPGWDDPDGLDYPLSYLFSIYNGNYSPYILCSPQLASDFVTYFFPGDLTVQVRVCDWLGGCTIAQAKVHIVKPTLRQLQSTLTVIKTRFNTAIATTSKIPSTVIAFAFTVTEVVDQELYEMLVGATKKYTSAQPTMTNILLATQLSCCVSIGGLTRVMNLSNLVIVTGYVTDSFGRCVEQVSLENVKTALLIFVGLTGRNDITGEIMRFNALMYSFYTLVPAAQPTVVAYGNSTFVSTSIVVRNSSSLDLALGSVKVQFPPTFLSDMKISLNTICDLRVAQYVNADEPSPTVSVSLSKTGTVVDNNVNAVPSTSLSVQDLQQPLNISLTMNSIVSGVSYTAYAKAENAVKWSTAGVNLALISYQSTIIAAYHLSLFKVAERELPTFDTLEWPELLPKSEDHCDHTYAAIILADCEVAACILFILLRFILLKRKVKGPPTPSMDTEKWTHETLPLEGSRYIWLVAFNPVFCFLVDRSYLSTRLLMTLTQFQSEFMTLGIANKVRFGDWSEDVDFRITAWRGFDFLCCVVALGAGQLVALVLSGLFHKAKGKAVERVFVVFVVLGCAVVNAIGTWLATTGCDGVVNRWTAEAAFVIALECLAASWINSAVSKYFAYAVEQNEWHPTASSVQ